MKILITGAAGFIGHQLVKVLAGEGEEIIGLDIINDYYDPKLKYARLSDTGITREEIVRGKPVQSKTIANYRFVQMDLTDREGLNLLFDQEHFTHVCNLAGQPGVRYSIENPYSYIQSNIVGFLNLLEACRHHGLPHFVYASSSSIYGMDSHVPFSETDRTDQPVSLYAATKKSDEAIAYAYSKLYGIQTIGLRFFTVYGPWGRPDMAPIKFMKAISAGQEISVFNHGDMLRDFTYVDDIAEGVRRVLHAEMDEEIPYRIYNIGNSQPVKLLDFIHVIEEVTGRQAKMKMLGMQPGDVTRTYADTSRLQKDFGYKPATSLRDGISKLYKWYTKYAELL